MVLVVTLAAAAVVVVMVLVGLARMLVRTGPVHHSEYDEMEAFRRAIDALQRS